MQVHREGAARDHPARARRSDAGLTTARLATPSEDAAWDDLVQATNRAHLLQTKGWAAAKALTGWTAERYVLDDGGVAQVLLKRLPLGLVLAYAPRGPLAVGPLPDAIRALRDALTKRPCVALLCDPEVPDSEDLLSALRAAGVRRSPVYVQPKRTLLMNPEMDPEALLAQMRKKTRQYIRKSERAGVLTEETTDLERFYALLRTVGQRDRFEVRSLEYFQRLRDGLGDRLHILMARVGNDDVGALMLARMDDRAWELYGGWSGTYAEERPFYLLKWRALQRMRQLGVNRYDMWGLSEPSPDAQTEAPKRRGRASGPEEGVPPTEGSMKGVENFKLGFGGEVVTWLGALETPVRASLYPVWVLAGRKRLARAGL